MYELDGKIRYSETDSEGRLTYPQLLNYFQDCSTFQSEELGVGIAYMAERNLAWVLSSWQICINEMPKLAEEVKVSTWPYKMQGFFGYRNFCMCRPDGKKLAYANSLWVLIDTKTGKPTRVPEEIGNCYPNEPQLEMECSSRKIPVPDHYEEKEPIPVMRFFIDTNQHVNNEKYVMIAQEFLPEDFKIGEIRVEYKKAALLNDVLYPRVTKEDGQVSVVLADENGNTYAAVLFLGKADA